MCVRACVCVCVCARTCECACVCRLSRVVRASLLKAMWRICFQRVCVRVCVCV